MKKYVKLIAVASLVVFMLCLCGCGEVKEAQNKLEDMLATLKKGDYVSALEDYVCEKEENRDFLLIDTVGFIRKLPHDLVEAFKSTLEETVYADWLPGVFFYVDSTFATQFGETIYVEEGNALEEKFPAEVPTKAGFIFKGWKYNDGTGEKDFTATTVVTWQHTSNCFCAFINLNIEHFTSNTKNQPHQSTDNCHH